MQHGFMSRYDFVTVAVNFDHHTPALLRAAVTFCQRSGKKLCLLHAIESWARLPASRPMGERSPLWDTTQGVEVDIYDRAMARLQDLALELPPMVQARPHAFFAEASRGIAEEAYELGTCLLLAGLDFERARYLPGAMSTALSLLQTCVIPVLVLDGKCHDDLSSERLDVFLADDLRGETEAAVAFAFELAGDPRDDGLAPQPGRLTHLHVSALSRDVMQASLNQVGAVARMQVDDLGLGDELHQRIIRGLEQRMGERVASYLEYFENGGGQYAPRLSFGVVEHEIERWAHEAAPDVLVFGRHHAYHSKPFYFGRMPFKAMLGAKRPVVVVPDA